jgi:hypothetical protein
VTLSQIPARQIDLETALAMAAEHTDECDGILIIMQKKKPENGLLYYTNDEMKVETVMWYLTSLQFQIQRMAAGL